MAPQPSSSSGSGSISSEASSLRAALQALPASTLQAPSAPLRRLLHQLSKPALISLVLHWLSPTPSSAASITPPSLSRRHASTSATSTFLELHESRRASSLTQLRQLWAGPMRAPSVSKARAVERILDVDWAQGISLHMCHMLACEAMRLAPGARNWSVARLDFDDGQVPSSFLQLSPQTLRQRLSKELSNYFTHHVHLADASVLSHDDGDASASESGASFVDPLASFTHLRVVLVASASDVCAGLSLLHLPGTRWLLFSGTLGRSAGPSARQMCLGAFAHAAHASGITTAGDELGEMRARDPLALREALLVGERAVRGVAAGGAVRAMARAEEEGPLLDPSKRKRLAVVSNEAIGWATAPREEAQEEEEPKKEAKRRKLKLQREEEAKKESRELFGEQELEVMERVDYELHLPLPAHGNYRPVAAPREAIRLRLSGPHLLDGLRAVVLQAHDRDAPSEEAADADVKASAEASSTGKKESQLEKRETAAPVSRRGLPAWLTEVRGSRIVVKPTERS